MPKSKKKKNIMILIFLVIVFIGILVAMYITGQNNITDNTIGSSTNGVEVELEQLGLPLEYDDSQITDLPQTGQSCYVPTPAISCSPTPSGSPTSTPIPGVTKTPTPTLRPGTTRTPAPTSTLLPTLSPNYVEMPTYVFLTVLDPGNCKTNIKGFYVTQQLVGHKIAGQAYLPYFTVLNGKGWKFDKVFNTKMQGESYYTLSKNLFTYYATINTNNLVYQQHTSGADIALTTRVVISKNIVLSGANTANPTAATRLDLVVNCK